MEKGIPFLYEKVFIYILYILIYGNISQVPTSNLIIFQVPLLHNLDEYIVQRQLREEEKRKYRVSLAVITFLLFLPLNLHLLYHWKKKNYYFIVVQNEK